MGGKEKGGGGRTRADACHTSRTLGNEVPMRRSLNELCPYLLGAANAMAAQSLAIMLTSLLPNVA